MRLLLKFVEQVTVLTNKVVPDYWERWVSRAIGNPLTVNRGYSWYIQQSS